MPQLFYPWELPLYPLEEAGWSPGLVWTGFGQEKTLASTGDRTPDRPARSESTVISREPFFRLRVYLSLPLAPFTVLHCTLSCVASPFLLSVAVSFQPVAISIVQRVPLMVCLSVGKYDASLLKGLSPRALPLISGT